MQSSLAHIAQLLGLEVEPAHQDQQIQELLIDSRQLVQADRTLFFALAGNRVDGHDFIDQLYQQGVRAFVVREPFAHLSDAVFLIVDNVVEALQVIVADHRQQFKLPVVGITGSNGKTIVKEWLQQALSPYFSVLANPRSFNSQIGVPLSVARLQPSHEVAFFEAGISKRGEMGKLAQVIQPTIGIFTNIGAAHQAGFSTVEEKLNEKLLLFASAEAVIYCQDQPEVHEAIQQGLSCQLFSWGRSPTADVRVLQVARSNGQTQLSINYLGQSSLLAIPLEDDNSIENAMHCCSLMLWLGLSIEAVQEQMALLAPVALRLRVRAGRFSSTIIDDTYSNDLSSLASALNVLDQQGTPANQRMLILSDMLESGYPTAELYQRVGQLIGQRIHSFVGIGPEVQGIATYLPATISTRFFSNTEEALMAIQPEAIKETIVLVKGARRFHLEQLADQLSQQTHRTILEVDRAAILHNLAVFKSLLRPQVKLAAMVKAAAYGAGGVPIGRLLQSAGVDYLVVAYPDEGRELRQAGIQLPIMVLNAEPATFSSLAEWQLEPEVYHWAQLHELALIRQPLSIHLKFDTGMHRLGFTSSDAAAVGEFLKQSPQLRVASIMSHLAASDSGQHDSFTHHQVKEFQLTSQVLSDELGYQPARHILNSSGIARFPEYQFEMVRLGIGLYGLESSGTLSSLLHNVLELQARVSQVRWIEEKQTVSYGRSGQLHRRSKIATLSIGYADGVPRAVGNGRFSVQINGRLAPTIGAICMDMMMVDVTDIDSVAEGDVAIIFGQQPTIAELAAAANTITYEILTNLSSRVHRVYVQE